jgi:hypothetical protein
VLERFRDRQPRRRLDAMMFFDVETQTAAKHAANPPR